MDSSLPRNLGIYLLIFTGTLIFLLLFIWPSQVEPITDPNTAAAQNVPAANDTNNAAAAKEDDLEVQCPVVGVRFIELVLIIGALGACLHAITSLAYHCSRKKFTKEWLWWYIYRPFVGGILALIFHLIINGGLIAPIDANGKKFFVILGLSGLIGLFSNQAIDRLSRIVDAIFASVKVENNHPQPNPKPNNNPAPPNEEEENEED